jgi:hypothetical protein
MKKQITLLIIFLLTACSLSFAQTTVKGTVTDSKNLPIPGVTVKVQETGKAVATDMNGNFAVAAAPANTLEFTSVGYTSKTEKVNGRTNIAIVLAETASN